MCNDFELFKAHQLNPFKLETALCEPKNEKVIMAEVSVEDFFEAVSIL